MARKLDSSTETQENSLQFDAVLLSETYKGSLARPIRARTVTMKFHTSLGEERWNRNAEDFARKAKHFRKRVELVRNEKLRRLMVVFEIDTADPIRWEKLATALAIREVPGMRVYSPHQTKLETWTEVKLVELFHMVKKQMDGRGHSAKPAIKVLKNKGLYPKHSIGTLYNRYLTAKNSEAVQRRVNQVGAIVDKLGPLTTSTEISTEARLDCTHAFWRPKQVFLGSKPTDDGWHVMEAITLW